MTQNLLPRREDHHKNQTISPLWLLAGAVGAILSALGPISTMVASSITQNEEFSEFFLVIAALPLLLTVWALYLVQRERIPQLASLAALLGLVGCGSLLLQLLLEGLGRVIGRQLLMDTPLILTLLTVVGLWLIVVNWGILQLGEWPQYGAWGGVIAGVSWLIVFGSTMINSVASSALYPIMPILGVNVLFFVVLFPLWALWLSMMLVLYQRRQRAIVAT